jgi:hypothetical protein
MKGDGRMCPVLEQEENGKKPLKKRHNFNNFETV